MYSKVVLITGSSSGLGKSLAVQLAQQGFKVYASMRDIDRSGDLQAAAEAAGVAVDICQLDALDTASVVVCVEEIMDSEGRIDVLVNNAGAGFVRTTEQASETEIRWVLDLNFLGVVRCTKAVLPHMRAARSGHVVNISSIGGLVGQPFNELYCAAKFAVEGYTESLAAYITPAFGINFTAVEPGGIRTEFASSVFKQFQSGGGFVDDEYKPLLERYLANAQARAADSDGVYQTPDQVAEVVVESILSEAPAIRLRTSEWSEAFTRLKTQADPDGKLLQQAMSALMA